MTKESFLDLSEKKVFSLLLHSKGKMIKEHFFLNGYLKHTHNPGYMQGHTKRFSQVQVLVGCYPIPGVWAALELMTSLEWGRTVGQGVLNWVLSGFLWLGQESLVQQKDGQPSGLKPWKSNLDSRSTGAGAGVPTSNLLPESAAS